MFEDSTLRPGTGRRSAWPLAASALLHLAAIGALALAAARGPAPGDGEQPIDVLFLEAAIRGAADAPARAPTPAERQAERERQAMLDRLVQPSTVPAQPPAPAPDAAAVSPPGTAGDGALPGAADLPVAAGGEVVGPRVIESSRVVPAYPEAAQRAGLQGLVVLKVEVDERGRVGAIEVLRGLGNGFDEAAVAAVRRWRFRPATRNGKPIKVFHVIPFDFRL
ncbi:MAG TPA: energy transducer TonB [Thermoanaerobaculia bacterium]|nr:energy transducer TonB [Thermoanaerobaculia bacterium]